MFNSLESIALSSNPRTPVLNCRISRALEPHNVDDAVRKGKPLFVRDKSKAMFHFQST